MLYLSFETASLYTKISRSSIYSPHIWHNWQHKNMKTKFQFPLLRPTAHFCGSSYYIYTYFFTKVIILCFVQNNWSSTDPCLINIDVKDFIGKHVLLIRTYTMLRKMLFDGRNKTKNVLRMNNLLNYFLVHYKSSV